MKPRFTVEERADRFQRRYTGPWRTAQHVVITHRYRRRQRIDAVRLSVAGHDLWTHAIERELIVPLLRRMVRVLARVGVRST
ncbi:MAG: hypothetical protein C0498_01405 [Anaerolinea sp.]|nr:hypothetical protein [Anaerolinea sp.]